MLADWNIKYSFAYDLQLFAKDGEGGEKTEEPTAKKLNDARSKGQAAKSREITTAASLFVFFIAIKLFVGFVGNQFLEAYHYLYTSITKCTDNEFTLQFACSLLGSVIQIVVITAIPFLVFSFITVFVAELAQVKWKISYEPLKPKFNKFNPVSGVKRLFSKDKIVDLLISVFKIAILIFIVYDFLKDKWAMVLNMYSYTLFQAIELIGNTVIDIGIRISVFFLIIAAIDWRYRKWKFHEDMKMTKQEVKDEYKNAEGDPQIKRQQRASYAAGIAEAYDECIATSRCSNY